MYIIVTEIVAGIIFVTWIIRSAIQQRKIATGIAVEVMPPGNRKLRQIPMVMTREPTTGWRALSKVLLAGISFGDLPYSQFVDAHTILKGVIVDNVNLTTSEKKELMRTKFDQDPSSLTPAGRLGSQDFKFKERKGVTLEDCEVIDSGGSNDANLAYAVETFVLKNKFRYRGPHIFCAPLIPPRKVEIR